MKGQLLLSPLPLHPHPNLVFSRPQPSLRSKLISSSRRLRASKRSFTPSTPLKKTARRRFSGKCLRHGGETRGSTAATSAEGENECQTTGATAAEVFPTGLVVSKHFRESFTGREILMLEVEKVGEGESVAVVLLFVSDALLGCVR